jgi:class 3 adenylate cyclase
MLTIKTIPYFFELVYFCVLHYAQTYIKEMNKRKTYNKERIIEVEIKRTHDLLGNLVPPPVLEGIMNDQKVVDEIEETTILFTDMVGFTQFSNTV